MSRSHLWTIFKIALAFALVAVVVSQTRWEDLIALRQRISLSWLVPSGLIFLAILPAMAWRYWALIERSITFRQTVVLVTIQTVVGNLLATSAGASSFIALLRTRYNLGIHQGVASVVLARFGDLLVLFGTLAFASWILWTDIAPLQWVVLALLLCILAMLVGMALVFWLRQPAIRFLDALLTRTRWKRLAIVERLFNQLSAVSEIEPRELRLRFMALLGYSTLVTGLQFAFGYANIGLFAIPISVWQMIWIMSLMQLMGIIPIQVFGGLGVSDITAIYLYTLCGVPQEIVVPIVIAARIYLYLLNIFLLPFLLLGDSKLTDQALRKGPLDI